MRYLNIEITLKDQDTDEVLYHQSSYNPEIVKNYLEEIEEIIEEAEEEIEEDLDDMILEKAEEIKRERLLREKFNRK